ncbi:UL19 major capsid protein [Meleagrid alphaherpesvirus 1]|uniref:UL19 major capsid protein n=1 Tax=Meleagrid herpesvirus 1 TaxID=37108 RepID=Q9DPR7_MEHV1|nr:major capsid protein [Meleagrid alphaherpesvirus 1]AKQ48583.1 major capsid protein [iBAC vector pMeHV1-C7]AKQ48655.1 major capsid protein [iBAC vector pMeHV1-C9]AKQ48727.1 major capsid protein [iBAC vector pMeHV1-C10]AKQ48799.1 major capsid protein [iBAC vector pMeHV1-C17]AKQ48871.1 major capsid protein [iBAC vector pMeHV1-C18]
MACQFPPARDCPPTASCDFSPLFNIGSTLAPTGRLLTTIEMSSHRCMFDYFKQFSSDDDGRYTAQFDILLGTYCNTLSLIRFLETGLSVACICTRAPDLMYMREGTVQFEIQQPMIAREGPHPADQPVHNYMVKRVCRRSLNAAFVVAAEALALLSEVSLDGTAISKHLRMRAIQQLARNVRTILDSFERGTVDQMLRILLEKAPPATLLIPLSHALSEGRTNSQVMRANLVSELKRRVCVETFIMSKTGISRESILSFLARMVNSTQQTISMPRLTHADSKGRLVDGVLVTTAMVRQKLLSGILNVSDTSARVPVTYGEMIISGTNLVTAVVMGKAVRNMDDVARYILNLREDEVMNGTDKVIEGDSDRLQMADVPAELVVVGDKLIFLEALERRVYQATQVRYPLIGYVDLTFIIPLGIYQRISERYARHAGDYAPGVGSGGDIRNFAPRDIYFYNKDNQLICLTLADAIGTVCHPSFLDIEATVNHLRSGRYELTCTLGAYVTNPPALPLMDAARQFFENVGEMMREFPRWVEECQMTTEQFMSTGNENLFMELHPAFDFFVIPGDVDLPGPHNIPQVMASAEASWRVCNGNIPLPLCNTDFRDALGRELSSTRYKLSDSTVSALSDTFADSSYPTAFYIIEAVIHGSERNFGLLMRLVIQCIRSYWDNSKRVAFINNFHMVAYIEAYLCSGELPEECMNIYKELMRHVRALRSLVQDYTEQTDSLYEQSHDELNHVLIDRTVLPPLLWDCDPLIYRTRGIRDRELYLNVGGEENYTVRPWLELQDADFNRTGNVLVHNRPVRDIDRQAFVPHHSQEWTILSKIYYYVVVPAFSRGQCCTMGIRFDNIYATSQAVIIPEVHSDEEPPIDPEDPRHPLNGRNLIPNTFNVLLHNARISADADALLTLQETVNNMAERTTAILYATTPDIGGASASTRRMRTFDGALHHGLLMMAYPCNDETIVAGTYFYPVPVNALFACSDHLAAMRALPGNIRTICERAPPVPSFLGANYYSTFRQPLAQYVKRSRCGPNEMSYALMSGYFKLSPLGLYHQLRTGLHPGIAFTVIRQDRFLADMGLFAERASESYFLGQVSVTKRPHAGGVQFSLTQPRANVDLGVGYTAVCTPLMLRNAVTDMGNTAQSLHLTRGSPPLLNPEADEFLRKVATRGQRTAPQRPVPFLGTLMPSLPSGLEHGQMSICEFIPTPVSSDLEYFKTPCNPRGRAAGPIHSGEDMQDVDNIMYDHKQGDPAYPFRATNNPWASQRYSYADRLYNGTYNLSGASPLFSPSYKFFTPAEVCSKTRCLDKLITEAGSAPSASTSDGEIQFKRPVGSTELTEDPCSLFQEAYPILCATDKALLLSYTKGTTDGSESHLAQYLIRDSSPIGGCLPTC